MKKTKVHSIVNLLLFLILIINNFAFAKNSKKDTDIVCFAAQKKWICAPKNNQEIAQEKAEKLIKETEQNKPSNSAVVLKPLNFPKMQAIDYSDPSQRNTVTKAQNQEAPAKPTQSENPTTSGQSNNKITNLNKENFSEFWSYQLIGVSTKQSAIKFVESNNLNKSDILIVESEHQGNQWYVILYNLYKDKDSGLSDKINLPSQLNKPWLRPLNNLKINNFVEIF